MGSALGERIIGVLGGMGPLATVDFMREVVERTPAKGDADHIPLIVASMPQLPDRVGPIVTGKGESPLPALLARRDLLLAAGARCLAMPCNTAHYWIEALRDGCPVPFISIVDASVDAAAARVPAKGIVGIIGTAATIKSGMFQRQLERRGYRPLVADEAAMRDEVIPAIAAVKQNRIADAAPGFRRAVRRLLNAGAGVVILACTEIPVALRNDPDRLLDRCVDTTAALAESCVRWALDGAGAHGASKSSPQ